jgi:putative ABC transport system ATP-binding protein
MLKLDNVSKVYRTTEVQTLALDNVSLTIDDNEFVAIMGPSGCGKSTLLNMLGLVDKPSSGEFWFYGTEVARYSEEQLTAIRREIGIGFIFQSFNLIDDLNVAENVEVALIYRKVPAAQRKRRIERVLERVGLSHRAKHMPQQLSGGQQQRVAVARALVCEPRLILADEPTGNLDTANGEAVMELIEGSVGGGTTVVMVTHSEVFAARAQRIISLLDGHLVSPDIALEGDVGTTVTLERRIEMRS